MKSFACANVEEPIYEDNYGTAPLGNDRVTPTLFLIKYSFVYVWKDLFG